MATTSTPMTRWRPRSSWSPMPSPRYGSRCSVMTASLTFLRARIADARGDVAQAARLVTECLEELPGNQEYLDFAVDIGATLPPSARKIHAERAATQALIAQAYQAGRLPSG